MSVPLQCCEKNPNALNASATAALSASSTSPPTIAPRAASVVSAARDPPHAATDSEPTATSKPPETKLKGLMGSSEGRAAERAPS